jgi:hypothetical protein
VLGGESGTSGCAANAAEEMPTAASINAFNLDMALPMV